MPPPDAASPPAPAARKTKTIIDLSQPLSPAGGSYCTGHPRFACEQICNVAAHGSNVSQLTLGSHTGTHVDAPRHFFAGAPGVGALDPARLVGRAVAVDVRGRADRAVIAWDALAPHEARFRPGVIVLLCTGWAQYWGTERYAASPGLDVEAARRLGACGVDVIGIDTLSPDGIPREGEEACYDVHLEVLGRGGAIVENLRGLEEVLGIEELVVSFLPLRMEECDGSPIRAVAWAAGEV
ncbi:putative cyclase [Dentipellis sp. KUC8613]|nr:putative cyclase [Dentipellis sp. KUC8613]